MKNLPYETSAPHGSRAAQLIAGADFNDAWCISSRQVNACALELFIGAAKRTPAWVEGCMRLRNAVVARLGLKNLGHLSELSADKPASAYQPGDRVGIFTLYENTFDEVLLGDKDKHLDVYLSVHRAVVADEVKVTVTTVVHVKNLLGRLYMLPVKPMHRIIAPSVLKAIG